MTREGFETYKLYLAMQRHFSTTYDFFKYNGKVNGSVESYQKRNDAYSFEKLSKLVIKEDLIDFFLVHFLDDPKCWIRSMSKTNLETYKAKMKAMPKKFREDCEFLAYRDLPSLLRCENDIPEIHKLVMNKSIDVETVIIIDKFYSFIDKHVEQCTVPFLWPDYIAKVQNYRPFLTPKIDDFYKDTMKDVFLNK